MLSTLRLLSLFLQTVSTLGPKLVYMARKNATVSNGSLSPSVIKFDRFVVKMEQRLKLTVFVLIQRMADEEKMDQVAQEAFDMHKLSEKMEKNWQHAQQSADPYAVEEMMNKNLVKQALNLEDDRKTFDQNYNEISIVDRFLYNNFSLAQLVKFKLDFLAILQMKKQFIS